MKVNPDVLGQRPASISLDRRDPGASSGREGMGKDAEVVETDALLRRRAVLLQRLRAVQRAARDRVYYDRRRMRYPARLSRAILSA